MIAPALPGFLAIMRDAISAIRARCSAMLGIEVPFVGCQEGIVGRALEEVNEALTSLDAASAFVAESGKQNGPAV
jgi:hypothetical protein